MIWYIVIISVLIIIGYGVGNYFYNMIINAKTDKHSFIDVAEDNHDNEVGRWFYEQSNFQDITIPSFDDLHLHAYEITNTDRWILIVHGYYGNAKDMKEPARRFYDLGFSVLMIDLRGHGKSEGNYIGFGGHDAKDVQSWIDYLNQKKVTSICLYGVSMGGATVMMCSDQVPAIVKGIIEDCGYSTLKEMFVYQLKQMFHLPAFPILPCANILMHLKAHYGVSDIQPIEHVKRATVPMLFIHGDLDTFVPFSMLQKNYDACSTTKTKVVIHHGQHANNHRIDPDTYWKEITKFLQTLSL